MTRLIESGVSVNLHVSSDCTCRCVNIQGRIISDCMIISGTRVFHWTLGLVPTFTYVIHVALALEFGLSSVQRKRSTREYLCYAPFEDYNDIFLMLTYAMIRARD